jgi:hypothetical protein
MNRIAIEELTFEAFAPCGEPGMPVGDGVCRLDAAAAFAA